MVDVPVEVKKAFKKGRTRKQYRIEVYTINDDNTLTYEFTIGNDNLVKESVKIDERMCSDRYLKFGLCEGSSMEFQYFGMDSVTGKELKVYLDVWYDDGEGGAWYPLMMGYYEVDTSSTQFSTGIRKVTAYNKLQAKYLDEKANATILEEFGFEQEAFVGDIINQLLAGYAIDKVYELEEREDTSYVTDSDYNSNTFKYSSLYGDQGPFGPKNVLSTYGGDDITTNTSMYLAASCAYNIFDTSGVGQGKTVKIEIPEYWDYLDQKIGEFYQAQLAMISSSTSATTLWNRIRDLVGDPNTYPDNQLTNYFFYIKIVHTDNSVEYYGKYAKNTKGGFADLNKVTFRDVTSVQVSFPGGVYYGPSKVYPVPAATAGVDNFNKVFCTGPGYPDYPGGGGSGYGGGSWYYRYQTNSSEPKSYGLYITPKMPDGTNIDLPSRMVDQVKVYTVVKGESDADYITVNPTTLADVTLRDLQSAVYEMNCQYGQINRETDMFSGVELGGTGLYPSETLYPANNLYPNGNTGGKAIHPYPAEYQKLWTDTVGVQSFRYLRITYKAIEDGSEVEKVLQRTVHEHGTQNYNMSDNWLFLNLVWTAEQVGEYADAMVEKMRDITWFPFEMWSVGLPYVETGDAIEIADKEGNTYTSYILQRQLKGIQNLQDSFINGELDVF